MSDVIPADLLQVPMDKKQPSPNADLIVRFLEQNIFVPAHRMTVVAASYHQAEMAARAAATVAAAVLMQFSPSNNSSQTTPRHLHYMTAPAMPDVEETKSGQFLPFH